METMGALEEMNRRFGIAGVAEIVAGNGGLPKVRITTAAATAEIYLHGAQVTSWCPAGGEEMIFLSRLARWEDGRAIRGGIPICFPWFRDKADDPQAPAHGFVRTKAWTLASITREGDAVTVSLATASDAATRKWWPHDFHLMHRITVGAELGLELMMTNTGAVPLQFEEALHTYHRVGDVEQVRIEGLDGAAYLDNTDKNREKMQQGDIVFTQATDRIYEETRHAVELKDPARQRRMQVAKENSLTTVVWNPWKEGAEAFADMGDEEWQQMVCVEASNLRASAVSLAPGEQHAMRVRIGVEKI